MTGVMLLLVHVKSNAIQNQHISNTVLYNTQNSTIFSYDNDYREVTVMCFFRWRAAEDSHSPHVGEGPGDHRV